MTILQAHCCQHVKPPTIATLAKLDGSVGATARRRSQSRGTVVQGGKPERGVAAGDMELLAHDADHHPDPPCSIAAAHMLHKNCLGVQGRRTCARGRTCSRRTSTPSSS